MLPACFAHFARAGGVQVAPTFTYPVKSRVVSNSDGRVIALGNLAGELKASIEAAVHGAKLDLLLTREPARAFVELEREGALAMLVDIATLGAEQFVKRARGTERLRRVPVIGMSRHPNELGFARVYAWGADDLVPLGAVAPLERRLAVLRDTPEPEGTGFGQAVVAEATTQRRALVGRVLSQAGYDVKFAVDRGAVELYACQSETRLVVISAALGDPRRMIEAASRSGGLPTWIVTAEARSVARLASALTGLDRVAVTSTSGSPEDVLFLANELVFGKGPRRRELRALYATPVAFRAQNSDSDEYGFSYDASPGGLYVRSLLPCETEDVEVELRLPNRDDRVRLYGRVARRFAFGSGSIASAPPGFSVKLDGPAPALGDWAEACRVLISTASDAFSDPPPRPRQASVPGFPAVTGAQPGAAGGAGLALPPATLTIESVVAPLPAEVLSAVDEGSDVGELLAATLDEQTLTNVGSKPVTIDPDTLGVREERPSEFVPAPDDEMAPDTLPRGAARDRPAARTLVSEPAPRLPLPAPKVGSDPETARRFTPAPRRVLTPADFDAEDNEETIVRASRPDAESPPPPTLEAPPPTAVAPPKAGEFTAAEVRPALDVDRFDTEFGATLPLPLHAVTEAPPERVQTPPLAPVTAPELAPTVLNPPPAIAKTLPLPAPTAEAWGPGQTMLMNPPEKRPLPPPERSRPQASAGRGSVPDRELAPLGNPFGAPERVPLNEPLPPPRAPAASSPALDVPRPPMASSPGLEVPPPRLPMASAPLIEVAPARPPTPFEPAIDVAAARPPAASARFTSAPDAEPPRPASSNRAVAILVAAAAAVAVGVGAAVLVPGQTQPIAATTDTGAAPTAERAPAAPLPSPTATSAKPSAAEPSATATEAPATAAPSPASAAPNPSAALSATATGATPEPAPTPAAGAVPDFDTTKLFADRAALFVHSSVDAHVFVHGMDYGRTNQMLVTSCGTRFVRLGRSAGDFLGQGRSYVLKCRKVNELEIEPGN